VDDRDNGVKKRRGVPAARRAGACARCVDAVPAADDLALERHNDRVR